MSFPYFHNTPAANYEIKRSGQCCAPWESRWREDDGTHWGKYRYKYFFHERCGRGWRRREGQIEYAQKVIMICRCRECDHPEFDFDRWMSEPDVVALFERDLAAYWSNVNTTRLMDAREYFDAMIETMVSVRLHLNEGDIEEAKHTIDHMMGIIEAKSLDDPKYPLIDRFKVRKAQQL